MNTQCCAGAEAARAMSGKRGAITGKVLVRPTSEVEDMEYREERKRAVTRTGRILVRP